MKFPVVLLCFCACLAAAPRFEYWPNATYDPAIPTEMTAIGHDPGDRISSPAEIIRYMDALAAAAPSRMKVYKYGETWEHRPLIYAVIGSEANMRRLDEIRSSMHRIADPRKTDGAAAQNAMRDLPAVIWLAYGVHGNEISSSDAAMMTAYHLLAARNDKMAENILANDLVILDPLQNPDGRNRFIENFTMAEGMLPDPSQLAAEHNEPWPGGRTNHYYFDMNRDWFAMTQPETRGRLKAIQEWLPLVVVDLHEMGTDSTYYFAPEAYPYNPYITQTQKNSLEWFGKNNSHYFDQYGFNYFTKEGYDEFYPGYGASWPLYYGSIAMTYEEASTRGLVVRKSDGTLMNYRDTVRRHFISSLSTLETGARNREALLTNFYQYRKEAAEAGARDPVREYILVRDGNVSEVDKLAGNLAFQGIEVKRATAPFTNAGKSYPAGSYVISCAQPARRLIRALLDPQVSMEPDFLKREEERRAARQPSEMYDVTAWSLPMQYGVTSVTASEPSKGNFEAVPSEYQPRGAVTGNAPCVAYLVPWGRSSSARLLAAGLRAGLRIASNDRGFTVNGRKYPAGSLIVEVKENPASLPETMARLAAETGAEVFTTDTGWMEEGPNFGSRHVSYFPADMKIAMAWDRPTSASAAGATRFVLERQYGYPVTAIRTQQLASGDLSPFNVILLPDGGYGEGYESVLGVNGSRHLRDWVQSGGTLIALGPGAVSYLADARAGMLAMQQENAAQETGTPRPATGAAGGAPGTAASGAQASTVAPAAGPGGVSAAAPASATAGPGTAAAARVPGKLLTSAKDFERAVEPTSELPDSLHGVLLRAKVNRDSWITAGVPETVDVMVTGRAIFTPVKMDRGLNAVYFDAPDSLLASGYMWEANRKQLAFKPFMVLQHEGRGNVVGFTADPNFRGYMDGLNMLFLNAVFRGPAHKSGGFGFSEE